MGHQTLRLNELNPFHNLQGAFAMRWGHRMAALVGMLVVMLACVGGDAPGRIVERREGSEIDGRLQGPRRKLLSLYIGSFRVGDNTADILNPTFNIYPTAYRWVGGDIPPFCIEASAAPSS
jgi:hypothetical protein